MSSSSTAINVRDRIEADRKSAHDEIDRKFDKVIEALSDAYKIVIAPSSAGPKRKYVKRNQTATIIRDTIIPPAPNTSGDVNAEAEAADKPEEDPEDNYRETEFFRDVNLGIREHLRDHPEGLPKSKLVELTGYTESVITESLKYLMEENQIRKEGRKRSTKYILNDGSKEEGANDQEASDANP